MHHRTLPRSLRRRAATLLAAGGLGLAALTLLPATGATAATPGPVPGYDYSHAIQSLAGCETNELAGNDDGSVVDPVPLGFDVNFYGDDFSQAFVNNNGNITFDGISSTYNPFPLEDASEHPIIAPWFTDVDTRPTTPPGRTLHYGSGTTSAGQKYFCVDWIQVAQFSQNASQGLDSFQLILFDASGVTGNHPGDFDIEFNYDDMPWDHGTARAGFAAGTGVEGTSLELPGGGVSGAMVNGGSNAVISSSANSATPGRYHFAVRGDGIVNTGSFTGTVANQNGTAISGARVQACKTNGYCRTTTSSTDGSYTVTNLAAGDYNLTAFPPNGSSTTPAHADGTLTSSTDSQTVNLQLQEPEPPPAGTVITDTNGTTGDGIPVIYWGVAHPTTFSACSGARSSQVRFDGFRNDGAAYTSTVTAVESPTVPGTYSFTIPEFDTLGVHGDMTISYLIDCIGDGPTTISYTIYIDPSGTVVDQNGDPVAGATVTLLTSDAADGTYTAVPDGSTVMSPSNRTNPDLTGSDGGYAWDVTAGFYKVRAEKSGCTGPGGTDAVESDPLVIPPAVTGLVLTLDCSGTTPVNQSPSVDAGGPYSGAVGTAIALHGSATDPDDDPLTVGWTVNTADCTVADPTVADTTVTCTVPGSFTATLTADDGVNPPVSDDASLTATEDTGVGTCVGLAPTAGVTSSTDPATGITTISGTSGNDVIFGTPGKDVIRAGAGNDVVCADKGDDKVYGGPGDDVLRGQADRDVVRGQAGNDTVVGNGGDDDVQGNDGNDKVLGGAGNDKVVGGMQTDQCNGGPGTDTSRSCEVLVGFP